MGTRSIHIVLVLLLSTVGSLRVHAQSNLPDTIPGGVVPPELGPYDTLLVPAKIADGTLFPAATLEWAWVSARLSEAARKRRAEWTRLRNAVYVTYPYAVKAGAVLNDIHAKTQHMGRDKRKAYIKTRERELKKEFADPLMNLSVYQGKVLMKLINRETGNNCYDIISEYKGSVTARLYQTVAFFFNSSLKQDYDPIRADAEMERIVEEVQRMYR